MEPDNSHIPYIKAARERLMKPAGNLTPAAVKFRAWLIKHNMSVGQAAMQCGFSHSTLRDYVCGRAGSYPSLAQAYAIQYMTGGKVRAWEWLDNPHIAARVRSSQSAGAREFERRVKQFVLKFNSLKTSEGMIRHRARILSRLFKVDWHEVKARCWQDGRVASKAERADISGLLYDPTSITQEEHDAQ